MQKFTNSDDWVKIYFKLNERKKGKADPTDVGAFLAENNYAPIKKLVPMRACPQILVM
jgi:hypothetical protein